MFLYFIYSWWFVIKFDDNSLFPSFFLYPLVCPLLYCSFMYIHSTCIMVICKLVSRERSFCSRMSNDIKLTSSITLIKMHVHAHYFYNKFILVTYFYEFLGSPKGTSISTIFLNVSMYIWMSRILYFKYTIRKT